MRSIGNVMNAVTWLFLEALSAVEPPTIFQISILEFVQMQSFVQNWNSLTLGPKMCDLGVFRLKFERNIFVIVEINNL